MTRGTGARLYRACQRCRKRKSKCDMNSIGAHGRPPCLECSRAGHDCVLAGSRRGGNFTQFRKQKSRSHEEADDRTPQRRSVSDMRPSTTATAPVAEDFAGNEPDEDAMCEELKNPFDALQILAKAAVRNGHSLELNDPSLGSDKFTLNLSEGRVNSNDGALHPNSNAGQSPIRTAAHNQGIEGYELVVNGTLDIEGISKLLRTYEDRYHAFVPLVPKHVLAPVNMNQTAETESFLLTTILTIASKDDPCQEVVHRNCWQYMKKLLLGVLLGLPSAQRIGSVEGLLLLSEWVPYTQLEEEPSSTITRRKTLGSTEDSAAWSLVGQAVRQAYLLRLDRTSFRREISKEPKEITDRKRLVWTFVYLADRQISVRMGQSFWSRGPSLSTKFTASDFPSLQPESTEEDGHAAVLQATIELTQLLHNVHDIIYTSKSRTLEIMLMGDYSRYLDDFLKALAAWDQIWGMLEVSPKLRSTLRLMYEYLCLYVNAFSLQAVISRSSQSQRDMRGSGIAAQSLFPRGVMASPDGRFIFEAVRAAKNILKLFSDMDVEVHTRYLPSRFYLYGIYSAVFLYRARLFGALEVTGDGEEVMKLFRRFMKALENCASSDHHIGRRYNNLLKSLWFPALGLTVGDGQMTPVEPHNNTVSASNTVQSTSIPDLIEISQTLQPESQDSALETMIFDPFCGSFYGFETDIFGFMPQDNFNFQGSNLNNI